MGKPNLPMRARAAKLQQAIWSAINETGERNVSVILAALADTTKSVTTMSLDDEPEED